MFGYKVVVLLFKLYHDKQEREVFMEPNYHDKFKLIITVLIPFKKKVPKNHENKEKVII